MDYKYIEQLLERYWNSQTTLEEEAILRAFFCQEDIPVSLLPYKPLFAYAKAEEENVLGDDFDARMEALVDEPVVVKAKVIPLRQRLMPLFKAAAVVAMILTLGNASQRAFNEQDDNVPAAVAVAPRVQNGPAVAMGDSVKMDTLKKTVAVSAILK